MIALCVRWVINRELVSYVPLCLGESQTELPHLWVNVAPGGSPAGVPTELAALSLCQEHVSLRFDRFCRNVAELHRRCREAAGVPLRDDMRAVVGLASYVDVEAGMLQTDIARLFDEPNGDDEIAVDGPVYTAAWNTLRPGI